MRLRLLGFTLLILFFALAAIILWPASALVPWVESGSNGHWRLSSTEGTVWNGSGMILSHSSDGSAWQIAQNVRWQLHPGQLWRGRLLIETSLDQGNALITLTTDGVTLEQIDAALPAPMLLVLLPGALGRYGWAGMIHARTNAFNCAWRSHSCSGEIELLWKDAAVAEVPGSKLGDYRFRLVGEGQAMRVDLSTLSGRLQINGSGEIAASGLRFKGEASATGPDAAALDAMLRTLGRSSGTPGKYLIDYREVATN
ncbi:MAG: type II secretion system protein N [Betaproteobacteria bacterium]|nr:type II secretion system protein N [Betaproteobacteria bacterium]